MDLCASKHPEILEQLRQHAKWMDKKDDYDHVVANDPDPDAKVPKNKMRDPGTGYYPRNPTLMALLESRSQQGSQVDLKGLC